MQKYDLHSVAFPTLSEAEMASLGSCPLTVLKKYKAGEKLFKVGDCDCSFFVGDGAMAVQFVHEYIKEM
jgi:thioredoxin reductase (NADPH)